jgi:hypothetical protein
MTRHTAVALALLASIGCDRHQQAELPTVSIPPPPAPEIPVDSEIPFKEPYRIISDLEADPVRREVEVKLSKKVTPEVLREIALEVKSREKRPHERTAIYYYLPVAFPELAGQHWAYSHFKPALDLKILGLTQQEEDALRKIPLEHKGKRIGAWLQDNQYKTLDLIYDEDGTIKIAEIQSPTKRSDSLMNELPSQDGRRFQKFKGSNIYEVDVAGNLRIFNAQDQLLSAATPLK